MLRAKAGYLVFLILMGTLALLYNTRFTFLLFLTCLALPVALLVLLAAAWPFVRIRGIAAPYTAEKGGRFPVEFEAQNRSLFPLPRVDVYLWYRNEFSEKKRRERISISLAGRETEGSGCSIHLITAAGLPFRLIRYVSMIIWESVPCQNVQGRVFLSPFFRTGRDSGILWYRRITRFILNLILRPLHGREMIRPRFWRFGSIFPEIA